MLGDVTLEVVDMDGKRIDGVLISCQQQPMVPPWLLLTRSCKSALQPVLSLFLDQRCNEAGPAGLVTGTNSAPVISMKILIEWDVVTPVRVILEVFYIPEDRSATMFIAREDMYQTL